MKKHILVILTLCIVTLPSCKSQSILQNVAINSSQNALERKIDSIVVEKMNSYAIPGLSIGVIESDTIVYAKGYGVKSIRTKEAVTETSNFHTASISKLFTAQAIMLLVQENQLGLEDKLITILPELTYKDERIKNITIQSLLNHTSGLTDVSNYNWRNNNQSDHSLRDYVLDLNLKLVAAPHTEYHYSNLGFTILGYVIEKRSETNFDEFVKENILLPNQMSNSDFRYFKIANSLKTVPHSKKVISNKIYERKTYPYTREHAPSSTLNSSALDLSQWMIGFLKDLASPDATNSLAKMIEPSFEQYPYIGLGFQLSKHHHEKTIGHYGGDKGYRSYLLMVPDKKMGVVLLANSDYDEDFRQEIVHPIVQLLLLRD